MNDLDLRPSSVQDAEFLRRQRIRNVAVFLALLVTVGLLYGIALVRFKVH